MLLHHVKKELLTFCDASEKATAAVSYMKTTYEDVTQQVGFVLGKPKLAPTSVHTIPRLELYAAVLAVEIAQAVQEHINTEFQNPDLPFILTPITLLTQKRNSMHEMISREADSSGKERNNLRSYPVISGKRNIYTPYRTAGNGNGQKGMFRSMMSSYLKIKTCIVTIGPWALSPKCSLEKMI